MTLNERLKKSAFASLHYVKEAWLELSVLAAVLVFDLVTKAVVSGAIPLGSGVTLIPNFLVFRYVHNENAAFGSVFGLEKILGGGVRYFLLIVTALAMVFFSAMLYKIKGKQLVGRIGLALIIAGALGNFVDRLLFGYVRDFIQIVYFGLDLPLLGRSFAIFNVADVGVTCGVAIFLVYLFAFYGKEESQKATPENNLAPAADTEGKDELVG